MRVPNSRALSLQLLAGLAAAVSLSGCALLPSLGQPPADPPAPPAPSSRLAPAQRSPTTEATQLLGDGLRVAPGTHLAGPVGAVDSGTVHGWYATLVGAESLDVTAVRDFYRRQLQAAGFVVSETSTWALRGTRRAVISPSPSAAPSLDPGAGDTTRTYAEVTVTPAQGPVPTYVRVIVTRID